MRIAFKSTATVHCIHDRQKRTVGELPYDRVTEKVEECLCCDNLFKYNPTGLLDERVFCPQCDPLNKGCVT